MSPEGGGWGPPSRTSGFLHGVLPAGCQGSGQTRQRAWKEAGCCVHPDGRKPGPLGKWGPAVGLAFPACPAGPRETPPSFLPGQVGTGEGGYAPVTVQTLGTMWEPPPSPRPSSEAGAGQGWEESWVGFGAGRPGLSNIISLLLRSCASGASPSTPGASGSESVRWDSNHPSLRGSCEGQVSQSVLGIAYGRG